MIPEIKISSAKRIMSLKDGSRKMSKSDIAEASRINIVDGADIISAKIAKATTGALNSPEVVNLLTIYKEVTGVDYKHEGEIKFSAFKKELAEALNEMLSPIREEYKRLMNEREALNKSLSESSFAVAEIGERNMNKVKSVIGYV